MSEVWAVIPGFDNAYQASSLGRIRSAPRVVVRANNGALTEHAYKERVHTPVVQPNGYERVTLWRDGRAVKASVHRLVLLAFRGLPNDGMEACHNDGERRNNSLDNLRWDTKKANSADRKKHRGSWAGECNVTHKLTNDLVRQIRQSHDPLSHFARQLGVSKSTISKARRGETWAHL